MRPPRSVRLGTSVCAANGRRRSQPAAYATNRNQFQDFPQFGRIPDRPRASARYPSPASSRHLLRRLRRDGGPALNSVSMGRQVKRRDGVPSTSCPRRSCPSCPSCPWCPSCSHPLHPSAPSRDSPATHRPGRSLDRLNNNHLRCSSAAIPEVCRGVSRMPIWIVAGGPSPTQAPPTGRSPATPFPLLSQILP
jgi:hypothetical protein